MTNSAIRVEKLRKIYAGVTPVTALSSVSLEIFDNEFFTLLGPSGCGKTTLLRLIAGFEQITDGQLHLFDEDISHLSPEQRPINTVFQNYSLFPHMNILENVCFGLLRQGKTKKQAQRIAQEMLELVQLQDFSKRMPKQLSGGQQQRVALARALAPHPKVLLLDEPLSALDLKLRQNMRLELKRLQKETGITFVFVTHDQEEALSMSDRIAVMASGTIQQIGSPSEIYEFPENRFVADFIGDANFFDATLVKKSPDKSSFVLESGAEIDALPSDEFNEGDKVTLMLRPEKLTLSEEAGTLNGKVEILVYMGDVTDYQIKLTSGELITGRVKNRRDGSPVAEVGEKIGIDFDVLAVRVLSK